MSAFWSGVVVGAAVVGLLGGPVASRLSAILEKRWDRSGERVAAGDHAIAAQVERLAADPGLLQAYQAQYWTWAGIAGGIGLAIVASGWLAAWLLDRTGHAGAAAVAAGATAILAGGIAMFWGRKLIAKRRITRLVYRHRSDRSPRARGRTGGT